MATASTPTSEDQRTQVARAGINGSNSLGEMLRRARELRGLTLERVARETKIPQRHLEALERDNFSVIPSGFYQRAELRTYAQAVGLDQRVALAQLESALAPTDTHDAHDARQSRAATTSPLPYIAMAVVAIAVVAVLFGRANVEDTSTSAPAVVSESAPSPAPPPSSSVPDASPLPALASPPSAMSAIAPEKAVASTSASAPTPSPTPAPSPAPAPAPAVVVTELVVTTEPQGARVTVNGIGWGTSPASIRYLQPGQKRIRVSKEGYVAVERVVQIEEGRRQTLTIRLDAVK
jgi:cytoskeletal protein RodZ